MPSTPPPVALRAHTPPTPLHGPAYDNYEPYSPRRSKRTTAHNNPYSSFNTDKSPRSSFNRSTPPPTTGKRARFARAPTQLSSPPSSPASPDKQRRSPHKTPRKPASNSRKALHSDSDGPAPSHPLPAPSIDPVTMLPTPSKTPKKRPHPAPAAITSTARILSFQPNDLMPSPRRIKKSHPRSRPGFELYDDDARASGEIEIYTDANARVPVLDESEENPFVGARTAARPLRRKGRKTDVDAEMERAVDNGEGVVYVFRGRKIFRPFESEAHADEDADQRRLRHQAGPAAQRPLTRSTMQPRLLFASEAPAQTQGPDDVDEEAVTDIEMEISDPCPASEGTGAKGRAGSPDADADESASASASASVSAKAKGKNKSPFDSWPRTKSSRKRAREEGEVEGSSSGNGNGKRSRSLVGASPGA